MHTTVSCCICRFVFTSTESDLIQSIRNLFISFHNDNTKCFHLLHHSFSSHLDLQGTFHYPIPVLDHYSSSMVESCPMHWNNFLQKHHVRKLETSIAMVSSLGKIVNGERRRITSQSDAYSIKVKCQ